MNFAGIKRRGQEDEVEQMVRHRALPQLCKEVRLVQYVFEYRWYLDLQYQNCAGYLVAINPYRGNCNSISLSI